MPSDLANKVCLIAGASGAIGSAIAQAFYRQGAHLALASHSRKADWCLGDRAASSRIFRIQFDVCRADEVSEAAERIHEHFGALDVLVNCTGIQGPIGPVQALEPDAWARTIEVNLIGSFHLVRAVVPFMLERGGGKIIHFSGGGAAYARPYLSAYGASKAALVRLTETLADELREANIQVNAVAPGPVRSRMWDEMRAAGAAGGKKLLSELAQMDETGGVSPERVAALAAFLASSRSRGLTGRLISAVHDRWEELSGKIPEIMNTEKGTLRRVPLG
jgi:NAD(P)-dependent dehydrogenase (short-subunit alcohol dehydrogenase family)